MRKLVLSIFLAFALPGATLYFGGRGEPETLDPASQWDDASAQIVANIYQTLVRVDPSGLKILPSLAVSWRSSPDGKTWIFNLRRGVRFSNGEPLTSRDVVFTFKRLLNKEAGRFLFYFLKDVEARGPYQVVFTLKREFSPFLHVLTVVQASVVYGKEGKFKPIGSGPYYVKLWQKGKRMILLRNPFYMGRRGNIDKVVVLFGLSMDSIYSLLMEGKLDMTNGISISKVEALKNSDKFRLWTFPILSLEYLTFNPSDPWAKYSFVREAISYLWNPRWMSLAFGRFRAPACRILQFGNGEKNSNKNCLWRYCPERAMRIVKRKGLAGKVRMTLVYPEEPLYSKVFLAFAHEAGKYGIKIKLFPIRDIKEFNRILAQRKFSIVYYSWIWDYPEPFSMLSFLLPEGRMLSSYPTLSSFPQAVSLRKQLYKVLGILSEKKREDIYEDLELKIYRNHLLIPIAQLKKSFFASSRISGVSVDTIGLLRYERLYKR